MAQKKRKPSADRRADPTADAQSIPDGADADSEVSIVGVGASAGGLGAFTELLEHLPAAPGFATVLVMHLAPTHTSDLAEILGRRTSMPVVQAEDGMRIELDHVYAIPPNVEMRLDGPTFSLSPRPEASVPSLSVDIFLTSMAEELGHRAIGVILSGSASDGAKGLAAIKSQGGIALVQDPATAAFSGMPESAIAAAVADAVLPIAGIATELVRLAEHPYVRYAAHPGADEPSPLPAEDELALQRIISRTRQTTGLDLEHYKRPTVLRRVSRRMAMRRVSTLREYSSLLETDAAEVAELLADVLVRVTSFFRDPEVFDALKDEVLPSILARRSGDESVRVWVPGCATGQEAYSIAIVLLEYLEATGSSARLQIFASDLREDDLAFARRGVFRSDIEAEVSEERLARFFTRVESGYQIGKTIREACVFARHDATKDPPFARMDLASCRNLLIYLDAEFQRRLLGTLHFALVPDGVLVLGNSEGTSTVPGLFRRTKQKGIYVRLPGKTPGFAFGDYSTRVAQPTLGVGAERIESQPERVWNDAQRQLDAMLLDKYAPAAVLVDDALQVRQIRGEAGKYLRFRPGDATLDLSTMISVGLASALRSGIAEVRETGRPTRRDGVVPQAGGGHVTLEMVIVPVAASDEPLSYAVLFDEGAALSRAGGKPGAEPSEVEYLRQELEAATELLRILREGRDAANESLQAANEEIQSSNEELQSMNEELETAKEELQSTNEELTTLNDELGVRNRELGQRNDDLNNLLVSASIPILVLDSDLAIRRFTAEAADLFNLIPGDVGRLVTDIHWRLAIDDVEALLVSVIRSREPLEREVVDDRGRWHSVTMRPFVTGGGDVAGAVVTVLDIDSLRRAQTVLERAELLSAGVNQVGAALGPVDGARPSTRVALDTINGLLDASRTELLSLQGDVWTRLSESPASGASEKPLSLTQAEAERIGLRLYTEIEPIEESPSDESGGVAIPLFSSENTLLGVLRIEFGAGRPQLDAVELDFCSRAAAMIAIFLERARQSQVLERLVAERTAELEDALGRLETATRIKGLFLANMNHELRTPLNAIIGFTTLLLGGTTGDLNEEQRRQLEIVLASSTHLLAIVSDMLDLSKITASAMPVAAAEFRVGDVVRTVGELVRPIAESKGVEIRLPGADSDVVLISDEQKTRQLLLNLVSNAVKFTDRGQVTVSVHAQTDECTVVVTDTGRGMTPEQLERAFEEFQQGDVGLDRLNDGTGLGLSIARRLARLLGGSLTAESRPGVGSAFTIVLPRCIEPS